MEENQNIENQTTSTEEPKAETKVDYEAELAKAMAEIKKMKATADKNASEAAEYKRKWKSSLDETQQANLAKEEADKALREELETLRRESSLSKMEKSFLALGYSEELATKAANAQLDNDTETLFAVQKQVMEQLTKSIKADLTKQMPIPPVSNESSVTMTQEQFDKLSLSEQVEFKNKNPELFKKFTTTN